MPAELTASPQRKKLVLSRLESPVKSRDDLLRLFVSDLGYERAELPIPITKETFGEGIALELAQNFRPVRLAAAGSFHIIYTELDGDRLDYWRQRVLATKLLETFQDSLFVFARRETLGDAGGVEAHLVNVKMTDRRVFRRFKLGPGERYRTTAERLALLDLNEATDLSTLAIRTRHDAAFDVEPVTRKFFQDFCDVFDLVRKEIRRCNKGLKAEAAERETQALLDRLLFLYFIQRKGWLNRQRDYLYQHFKSHFAELREGTTYLDKFLRQVFVKLSTEGDQADVPGHELPFLNGGLFTDEYAAEQLDEASRQRYSLKIGNAVFRHVFDDLLEVYNFTVREDTPLNQDVAIDPEMLGKIFESLVLQLEQTDTSGKTSRHDTGSHYTPRPIVHYLCQEGLRVWLEQSPPNPARAQDWPERLKKLLAIDASDGVDPDEQSVLESCLTPDEARILLERLDQLRACDPAVGSGAFPVGLLHELVNLARLCETRSRGKDPVEGDREWLFNIKSRFIQRVIYGVDIQDRAIEICKLRLWLSLIVDHPLEVDVDKCSAKAFRTALKKLPALPNLDFKIRRANSLIDQIHGEPVNLGQIAEEDKTLPPILNRLTSAKREFYAAYRLAEKRRLRFDILDAVAELAMLELSRAKLKLGLFVDESDEAAMQRLTELDRATKEMALYRDQIRVARRVSPKLQDAELERLGERFNSVEKPTFVWQLDFAEVFHRKAEHASGPVLDLDAASERSGNSVAASGFDIMLANPPYVRMELFKDIKPDLRARYPHVHSDRADLYCYFYARAFQLLTTGGVLSFITSNKFFRAGYGEPLRKFLVEKTELRAVIDFNDLPIFEATAYPCIVIARNREPEKDHILQTLNVRTEAELPRFAQLPTTELPQRGFTWRLESPATLRLLEKMKTGRVPLGTHIGGKIFMGIKSGLNEAFLIDGARRAALIAESPRAAQVIKPYVGGKHVRKWLCEYPDEWMIYMPHGVSTDGLDAVLDHLRPFKKQLERRATEQEWYELQQPQEKFTAAYSRPKIIFPDIANDLRFALDKKGAFFSNTAYCVATDDLYLLAVLNAKTVQHFYVHLSAQIRGGYLRFWTQYVEQIPIPTATTEQRSAIVNLVEHLLFLRRQPSVTDSDVAHPRDPLIADYFEQWLNALIYELFFPEELHAQKLNFFTLTSKAGLPPLENSPKNDCFPRLRDLFEKLYDLQHELRASLFSLGSLELVRIIEGKE